VDYRDPQVHFEGHVTAVRPYPVSADTEELVSVAESADIRSYAERLAPLHGEQTILRVDRAEPSKNILRGFHAFELLLREHPEFLGHVKFLAFMVPSRTQIPEYRRYVRQLHHLVVDVNRRHGWDGWQPIELFYEENRAQAIAAMQTYDVLLVNPVIDGMNLVAKEGAAVNQRDGVLVLSETAGAYEELAPGALAVAPADVEGTAEALFRALTMPAPERRLRARTLRETVTRQDIFTWVLRQLEDLRALSETGRV
jgi:trehalose 6-phosphate synthase